LAIPHLICSNGLIAITFSRQALIFFGRFVWSNPRGCPCHVASIPMARGGLAADLSDDSASAMKINRGFLDKALIVGAAVMALASLFMLILTIQQGREAVRSFRGNLMYYLAQVEDNLNTLQNSVEQYTEGKGGIDLDDLIADFKLIQSNVRELTQKDVSALDVPEIEAIRLNVETALNALEPDLQGLPAQDGVAAANFKVHLREVFAKVHSIELAIRERGVQSETAYVRRQLAQIYFTVAFIVGLILFGALSIINLRLGQREVRMTNARLEKRVGKRTKALELANQRLAEQVAEREADRDLALEREARLVQAAQLAKLGYYVWDAVKDVCEYCSEQHARVHGLSPAEYIARAGKLDSEFSLTHPDDREMLRAKFKELRQGAVVEMEYRVTSPTGDRRLRETACPIFDDAGRVVKEIGTALDITDQYETELKLAESQRMDAIGKLTGGIAHDFNNLLAVVLGNLELLNEDISSAEHADMITDAIRATLRGRDLTMNMLSFARRAPLVPAQLGLNKVVAGIEPLLRRTLPENITLDVDLAEDLWDVTADQSLTESALLNLALNARDAMPKGGTLSIVTSNVVLDQDYLLERDEEIAPGHYVMLAVMDSGEGIDESIRSKVFDPFFTTKGVGENSGLGLSMVQGFIKQTGGMVEVCSRPGVGTRFKLYFRSVSAEKPAEDGDLPDNGPILKTQLRVLLVEDDAAVRKILTLQLQKGGAVVESAPDGDTALKLFQSHGPFDLVVSDIVMPGEMQGPALIKSLRQVQCDLPVVFLSGYPREATVLGGALCPNDTLLVKPVSRTQLLRAVGKALAA
jgi:PAS domain S-box-containing protein